MAQQAQHAATVLAEKQTPWRIRTGTAADYGVISDLLVSVYGQGSGKSADAIRWLYEENPAGLCLLWLAEEEATGRIVSVNPMFPWRISVGGREVLTAQAGDAATHPDFQGKGIW